MAVALSDLPLPFLRLLCQLDECKKHLPHTCKTCFRSWLAGSPRCTLTLDVEDRPLASCATALALALEARTCSLKLHEVESQQQVEQLLTLTQEQLGTPSLPGIINLTLQLVNCNFSGPALVEASSDHVPCVDPDHGTPHPQALRSQLSALRSMHMSNLWCSEDDPDAGCAGALLLSLPTALTHLLYDSGTVEVPPQALAVVSQRLPNLVKLQLANILDAQAARVLLPHPSLRALSVCGFDLAEDLRPLPCHLHCLTLWECDLQVLAWLPLHSLRAPVTITPTTITATLTVGTATPLQLAEAAVANCSGCGVQWECPQVSIQWEEGGDSGVGGEDGGAATASEVKAALLVSVMPLLRGLQCPVPRPQLSVELGVFWDQMATTLPRGLEVVGCHMNPGVLQALHAHLYEGTVIPCVTLRDCSWDRDSWGLVGACLPPSVEQLSLTYRREEAAEHLGVEDVEALCAGVHRAMAIAIKCHSDPAEDWCESLRRAGAAAAGHEGVTVRVEKPCFNVM